jgi:hypothetical protein
VLQDSFLPLDDLTYVVAVANQTPDTWDELAVSYVLQGQTATIATVANVAPNREVQVPLGPCSQVVGYNFAVFVDGLAVDFDPDPNQERLQFPLAGSMNAWRSFLENPHFDWNPAEDFWRVGG